MRRFLYRILHPVLFRNAENELNREINSHLALLQDDFERKGLPPEDARRAAQRAYGGVEQVKELHRDERGFPLLDHLLKDLRFGARSLIKNPLFSLIAIATLALGVGANTAIFSVVDAVLLRPLPFHDSNRLVTLLHDGSSPVANANYIDWREATHSFETMAAASAWSGNATGSGEPEKLLGLEVTQNLLPMLGVRPLLGRFFRPAEDHPGTDHEVILSHRLWTRKYNANPNVLGQLVLLNGEGYTVVGVMPAGFAFPPFWAVRAELWVPDPMGADLQNRGGNHLRVFAKLRDGVSLTQAQADVAAVTGRLEHQFPGTNRGVMVRPLKDNVVGDVRAPLVIAMGAVGFVLLITCANVAHMLLARSADREREIAVRIAVGASRRRIATQFLTEGLLLALAGGGAGLLLAFWLNQVLVRLAATLLPRAETATIDARIVLFLLGTTLATMLLFALFPALEAAAANTSDALKEGGRSDSGSRRRSGFRSLLISSEFALAFVLVIAAGLLLRSFALLATENPGFNPHGVFSMVVSVQGTKEFAPGPRAVFYDQLLERVRALPGVAAAGGINHLPLAGDVWGWDFLIAGRARPRPGELPLAIYRLVTPGYFPTMRLPIVRGRDVNAKDDQSSAGVVIINERAARAFWPGQDPIGQRISFVTGADEAPVWLSIIGIAADAKEDDWVSRPGPVVYLAARQNADFLGKSIHASYITLVVRSTGEPDSMIAVVKKTVWSIDPNLPISDVLVMDDVVTHAMALQRLELVLFAAFGVLAVALAVVGAYGVTSYLVARRTREIGIRLSLGASRVQVRTMLMAQGFRNAALGLAVGLAGALLLSRFMTKLLFGIQPTDPMTYVAAAVSLVVTALVANLVPADRASRVEPIRALRDE